MNNYSAFSFRPYKIKLNGFLIIFAIVSVLLLIVSYFVVANYNHYKQNGQLTQAKIVDVQTQYSGDDRNSVVYVGFDANGIYVEGRLNQYSSSMQVGDIVNVLYMTDDPTDFICADNGYLVPIILGSIGAVLLVVCAVALTKSYAKRQRKNQLLQYGEKLQATVISVTENVNVTINGRHPYKIECQDDNGNVYKETLLYANFLPSLVADKRLTVYVDYLDKSKYFVDLDALIEQSFAEMQNAQQGYQDAQQDKPTEQNDEGRSNL